MSSSLMRPALTPDQRRQVRSLVEDSGYTRDEAIVLVREGFADEPGPDCRECDGSGWTVSMERSADGYGRERKERCACNPDPNRGGGAW